MRLNDIRKSFLDFFKEKQHTIVPSSSLVPSNDPTLLFTNAGMVPFKEVFLGQAKKPYTRATSSQRCVRAGGKHNDLENVGYTARHHTFFEMLGNFSFGDYSKREAIAFAWEYLTDVLNLPQERLWVTVYQDDDKAANIWLQEIGVSPERFSRCGEKDNFWSMGDVGPCGPCSEIFYDHGENIPGGPPGGEGEELDRYIEIWNLVFMQYERTADGELHPLPKPSVDTGMGLERIAAVMQGVHNNYDIDLFQRLIHAAQAMATVDKPSIQSLRVIADHIRSTSFLIADGVLPSNEGRGYVLRRIIRRAIRHGHALSMPELFFSKLVPILAELMGDAYPELRSKQKQIQDTLVREEQQFVETLDRGLRIFEQSVEALSGDTIPGDIVFKLYDTYGFPVDLTADIAREKGLHVDIAGFETAMQQQRSQSQQGSQFAASIGFKLSVGEATQFTGHEELQTQSVITSLFKDNDSVKQLDEDESGHVVLDKTPFYSEGGGQVGDKGSLHCGDAIFIVHDTKAIGTATIHHGMMKQGNLTLGDRVVGRVDTKERQATALNHTATHLLHAALRQLLGEHVEQKGSLVDAKRLRFDFTHFSPVTPEEMQQIENLVNEKIRENIVAEVKIMSLDEAKKQGAMALFSEKYGEQVRVLKIGEFSIELCGGTHVHRTGDLGLFKLVSEGAVAAGVRRIEAVTGQGALDFMRKSMSTFEAEQTRLKARQRELQKQNEQLKAKLAAQGVDDLTQQAKQVNDTNVLLTKVEHVDAKALRDLVDNLKQRMGKAVIVMAAVDAENKVSLIAGVTDNCTDKIKAGDLIKRIASEIGGRGGGRADMAQGGGTQPENLEQAFQDTLAWVSEQLT